MVRNILMLVGCVAVLGVAGVLATTALRSATVSPTQSVTAPVVVDANDAAGAARLTVLAPVRFDSGGGTREVAAGTEFTTTNALLTGSLPAHGKAGVGTTLSCALRVGMSRGQPVIDLLHCLPAHTSARG